MRIGPNNVPIRPGDVLFLHGLEGSPQGNKAVWLRSRYGAEAIELDTSAARAAAAKARLGEPGWRWRPEDTAAAIERPLAQAREALRSQRRRLVIGSSFGGALLVSLLHARDWAGPSLLLAPAHARLGRRRPLPTGARALLIHGTRDATVPLRDSRTLAADSGPAVELWEVDGDHRLATLLIDDTLHRAIAHLLR